MSLHANAVRTLQRWEPPHKRQRELRQTYLDHLGDHPDAMSRHCHPDHLTASALVVSDDRERVLLNLHGRYRIWMQFGGHCEPDDATLAEAALREAVEESGVEGLVLVGEQPAQLDVHEVWCGPIRPAHHLDVRYVAAAPTGAAGVASDESLDVRWFPRDALPAGLDAGLRELIDASREL